MAFIDGQGGGLSAADIAAVTGGNGGNGGYGFGDGNGAWWLIILFLFASMNGGWGNGGFGGGGGGMPYAMFNNDVQRGFDQQATIGAISNLQQTVGNGFADAAVARCNGNAAITQAITNGNFATLQAINGAQAASTQNMNNLAMALQNCCCQNSQGIESLRYTVATEACADRQAINDGIRDVIANNTANTQAIINSQNAGFQAVQDKLCQLELDSYKQKVSDLTAENAALRGAASQTAQTAQLLANNEAQTANILQRLNPAPIPAYVVQNPACCNQNYNYGCGCGVA